MLAEGGHGAGMTATAHDEELARGWQHRSPIPGRRARQPGASAAARTWFLVVLAAMVSQGAAFRIAPRPLASVFFTHSRPSQRRWFQGREGMRTMIASMSGVQDRQGPVSSTRGGGSGGRGPRSGGQKGDGGDAKPYPSDQYDPVAARQYFLQRPWEAVSRAVEIASQAGGLFVSLWIDEALGRVRVMEDQRAREAVQVIIRLGPTFVKIGQSLSVRGDLLPAAYIKQLTSLTDRVPFFDDAQARAIILEDLALPSLSDMFSDFSQQPVAAASLGQVYRGKLREDGRDVAVKVQRPGASKLIACDLFLLRLVASPLLSAQVFKSTQCSDFLMVYVLGH